MPLSPLRKSLSVAFAAALIAGGLTATAAPAAFAAQGSPPACTPLSLQIKVFLTDPSVVGASAYSPEAPFPTTQPYRSDAPGPSTGNGLREIPLRGGENSTTTDLTNVIDWVVIELRSPATPDQITATDVVPALADGTLQRPAQFNVKPGNYLVAVDHRNHLGIMTANPVAIGSATPPLVDFTSATLAIYIDPNNNSSGTPRETVDGRLTMWRGDAFKDSFVDGTDRTTVISNTQTPHPGYEASDVNLDGQIDATDNSVMTDVLSTAPNGFLPENANETGPNNSVLSTSTADLQSPTDPSCSVAPVITSGQPTTPAVGGAYSFPVTATGTGPITFSVTGGALPAGLTLDPDTGIISGTPTTPGTYGYSITATNAVGSVAAEYITTIPAAHLPVVSG